MPARFRDPLKTIESFGKRFLVVCPQCHECALVLSEDLMGKDARFVCPACGRAEMRKGPNNGRGRKPPPAGEVCTGGPLDWYFRYPVWPAAPCCGETLWAYNEEHLDFLEAYVSATLRERPLEEPASDQSHHRPRNSTLASRLPGWMKAAKNRRKILTAVLKLRRTLPRDGASPTRRNVSPVSGDK